jgi:hypothetical protein
MSSAGFVPPGAPPAFDDSTLGGVAGGFEAASDEVGFSCAGAELGEADFAPLPLLSTDVAGFDAAESASDPSPEPVLVGICRSSRTAGFSSAVNVALSPLVKPAPGGDVPQLLAMTAVKAAASRSRHVITMVADSPGGLVDPVSHQSLARPGRRRGGPECRSLRIVDRECRAAGTPDAEGSIDAGDAAIRAFGLRPGTASGH